MFRARRRSSLYAVNVAQRPTVGQSTLRAPNLYIQTPIVQKVYYMAGYHHGKAADAEEKRTSRLRGALQGFRIEARLPRTTAPSLVAFDAIGSRSSPAYWLMRGRL